MPAYEFVATDDSGREQRGVLDGDSPRHVRARLRERGLFPLAVDEVRRDSAPGRPQRSHRVSPATLALVTRQLATLVRAALPLEEALQAAARQTADQRLQSLLLAVRARVVEGHSLADGLALFPEAFPDIYVATVAAGEQSGRLDLILERLADWTERRHELRQKLRAASYYPVILTVVTLLVTVFLMSWVVPQVVGVFENLERDLPLPTVVLIAVSDWVRQWGLAALAVVIVAVIMWRRALRDTGLRRRVHARMLHLPVLSRLIRGLEAARFARTFSILTGAGVPVLESLRIAATTVANLPMRDAVDAAAVRVREGTPIARALDASGLFPPLTIHLIASGESSGRLAEMLERAAMAQEREMESAIGAMMALVGPLLILVMGAIVMAIVLAVLLPIFNFNQIIP